MGDKVNLKLQARSVQGKKVKKLREQGFVPGVVYGHGVEPIAVQAEYGVVEKVVRHAGRHTPVYLAIDSKKKIAMIKDIDRDPVGSRIRHVSFHAVKANEPVVADIPIHLVGSGESEAERAGLIVLQALEKIEVKALPMDLPEALEVSTASLKEAGDRLTVADIVVPENVEIVDNDDGREGTADDDVTIMDLTIATVYEPSSLQAANDAAGGDAEDASADSVESENGAEDSAAPSKDSEA